MDGFSKYSVTAGRVVRAMLDIQCCAGREMDEYIFKDAWACWVLQVCSHQALRNPHPPFSSFSFSLGSEPVDSSEQRAAKDRTHRLGICCLAGLGCRRLLSVSDGGL